MEQATVGRSGLGAESLDVGQWTEFAGVICRTGRSWKFRAPLPTNAAGGTVEGAGAAPDDEQADAVSRRRPLARPAATRPTRPTMRVHLIYASSPEQPRNLAHDMAGPVILAS